MEIGQWRRSVHRSTQMETVLEVNERVIKVIPLGINTFDVLHPLLVVLERQFLVLNVR